MITEYKTTWHESEYETLSITGTMITIFSTNKHLLNIQVENHGYCMTIVQVGIVACQGMKKEPGRSAVKPRKDLSENVLSQRGLIKGRGKMVIFSMPKHNDSDTNRKGSPK